MHDTGRKGARQAYLVLGRANDEGWRSTGRRRGDWEAILLEVLPIEYVHFAVFPEFLHVPASVASEDAQEVLSPRTGVARRCGAGMGLRCGKHRREGGHLMSSSRGRSSEKNVMAASSLSPKLLFMNHLSLKRVMSPACSFTSTR